jgi:rare lipoprotein A
MPMPRVIGISLACLVTSACATARPPEKDASHHPGEAAGNAPDKTAMPNSWSSGSLCWQALEGGTPGADFKRTRRRREFAGEACRGRVRVVGNSQTGVAAWYDLVGRKTASGDILDTVTATAAHRSLPLSSLAKVTDLDNGRSVVVKINDRGPYTRGRILDLSPRAADLLDMKAAGVAAVVIEPVAIEADPSAVAFQTVDTEGAP